MSGRTLSALSPSIYPPDLCLARLRALVLVFVFVFVCSWIFSLGGSREQTDTPLDSPRSGSGSDAAYDSLRGVLSKVSLGKYFKDFRRREVRLEDLRHLTEGDLTEVRRF